jgi:hypothetical protein
MGILTIASEMEKLGFPAQADMQTRREWLLNPDNYEKARQKAVLLRGVSPNTWRRWIELFGLREGYRAIAT